MAGGALYMNRPLFFFGCCLGSLACWRLKAELRLLDLGEKGRRCCLLSWTGVQFVYLLSLFPLLLFEGRGECIRSVIRASENREFILEWLWVLLSSE
ncbi:hypothetical protein K402DRAFT_180556 [Aulographum hederae CBS 113979]|uniref:Uncharacterized protein n=1 Tax=Aulographum hederae CBS 113979 TaxID=1176131 RepID=A0A6G1GPY9_9PEZI|nr:hypothetical protein K402DRAFT_180556 [Aulographum hederae CBS 113979]